MIAFELLAYVVTFVIVLGLVTYLAFLVMLFVNRNSFVKEHKERKGKRHEIEL